MYAFTDPRYVAPTPDDLRAVMHAARLTGSEVTQLVGVDSRTVRKWTGGERAMPYSAWRLLLLEAELAPDDECTYVRSDDQMGVIFEYRGQAWIVSQGALDDHFDAQSIGNAQAFQEGGAVIMRATMCASARDSHGRREIRSGDIH